jgi:hypothetical protein
MSKATLRRPMLGGVLAPLAFIAVGLFVSLEFVRNEVPLPLPSHYSAAEQLIEQGVITTPTPPYGFLPVGHPLLLALFIGQFGPDGVVVLNAIAYAVTVLLAFALVRQFRGTTALGFAIMALVAFHPYMLLDIKRVNDNSMNALLFLALGYELYRIARNKRASDYIGYGLCVGLLGTIRPNALVFLIPPLLIAPSAKLIRRYAAMVLACACIWMCVSFAAMRNPFFFPENGPITAFHGNNRYSKDALLADLNGEGSTDAALRSAGLESRPADPSVYSRLVAGFVWNHPGEWAELLGIKTFTLLRPDWRQADTPAKQLLQVVLALPVPIWALSMLLRARRGLDRSDWLMLVLVGLYVAPFILINSDPRFRFSLDIAAIVDLARVWSGWRWRASSLDQVELRARVGARSAAPAPQS